MNSLQELRKMKAQCEFLARSSVIHMVTSETTDRISIKFGSGAVKAYLVLN